MGNVFDTMAAPNQPQPAPSAPSPTIPAPVTNGTTEDAARFMAGLPGNATPDQRTAAVSTGVAGNVFDQMAKQSAPPVTKIVPPVTTEEQPSDTMAWLKKVWSSAGETVGEHIPQAATGPLAVATHNVIEPYEESMAWAGKKAGQGFEKAATFQANADEVIEDLVRNPTKMPKLLTQKQVEDRFPRTMGLATAGAETLGTIVADPRNWPLMAGKFAKPILNQLLSGAFAANMGSGVKDQAVQLAQNWDNMSPFERYHAMGQIGLGTAMTAAAAVHAAAGGPEVTPTPTPEGGTVTGERTTLRPTTVKTAGVEAPIAAIQQENPNVFTKMATAAAGPGELKQFQTEQTRPAATRQMVSTLSQSATDQVAAHDALVNGEVAPAPITGTQTAGAHTTPDEIWQDMQRSAGQTYDKARAASAQDLTAWNQERVAAERVHQQGIDHYNELVDAHNADPANKDDLMQPIPFTPADADVREKPLTFDELKATLDNAKERTGYNNATDVRQKARDVEVPKAEKALDDWFGEHEDQVPPMEYESAKQLWANSERFKEIATSLRKKLTTGTVNGNDIRGLEAVVNGKAIRRRGAAGLGEFQRLLGPEATANLSSVAKLFDPLSKTDPRLATIGSWGMYGVHGLLDFLGYHEFGVAGAVGAEVARMAFSKLMNHILFNPELGSSFVNLMEATKTAFSNGTKVPREILSRVQDHVMRLWASERGEAEVPFTGKMGQVGETTRKYNDVGNGVHQVVSHSPTGEAQGQLMAKDVEGNPDVTRIASHWVAGDVQHEGLGTNQIFTLAKNLAEQGKTTLLSDLKMTESAKRPWEYLKTQYPDAITKTTSGYMFDLTKLPKEMVGTAAGAKDDTAFFTQAKNENPQGSFSDWAKRAQELKDQAKPYAGEERRAGRRAPMSATELEEAIKLRQPVQTPFDVTKGARETMANDKNLPKTAKEAQAVAEKQVTAHDANGGSTFTPAGKDLTGVDKYSVGSYPNRTEPVDNLTPERLQVFKDKNADVLSQPNHAVGTWKDTDTGKHVLDVVKLYSNRDEAIAAGKAANQKSIYHLGTGELVDTGGTGEGPLPVPDRTASEITTRRPTAVGADLGNNPNQHANLDAIEQADRNQPSRLTALGNRVMGYKEKLARTVADYTGVNYTPEELANPDKVLSKFVNHVSSNLEWLYNQVPEEIRGRTRQWYDSAHRVVSNEAQKYGYSPEQGAGVTAALSPQNPWDNNLGLAKRMMDIYKNRQTFPFSPEMEKASAELRKIPTQSKAFKGLLRDIAGKKLSDVKNANPNVQAAQRALWVRLYDEAHNSPINDQYSPTGEVVGHSSDTRSWIGLDHMLKAVKILDDGSVKNINDAMGQGHKIRNFYNNLVNPNSTNGHTTIDTHATGAALLQPLSSKDMEASHTFGNSTKGTPRSAERGFDRSPGNVSIVRGSLSTSRS